MHTGPPEEQVKVIVRPPPPGPDLPDEVGLQSVHCPSAFFNFFNILLFTYF